MELKWQTKYYTELTGTEVYEILRLRTQVFIVEQHCPYLDADRKDFKSYHLMGWEGDKLIAYARLIPPGVIYNDASPHSIAPFIGSTEASIGRVVVSPDGRGTGAGVQLMQRAVEECKKLFGDAVIRIGAQMWLRNFYIKSGFEVMGEPFYEDGIAHLIMLRKQVES